MKRILFSPRWLFLAVVVAVLAQIASAHATVMVALSRQQLAQRADRIVRVTVGAAESRWNEDHSQIITLTTLNVRETWRGAPASTLTLRQFGGTVGDVASAIPGDAHLRAGQDVVLFLRQGAGVVYLSALAQSAYFVDSSRGEATVARDLNELAFAAPNGNGVIQVVEASPEGHETLAHLRAEVLSLVRGAR